MKSKDTASFAGVSTMTWWGVSSDPGLPDRWDCPDPGRCRRRPERTIPSRVEASPLAAELAKLTGAELHRAGRIAVLPDLTLPGHPEVFVVGDMMSLDHLPGVAEVCKEGCTPPTPSSAGWMISG